MKPDPLKLRFVDRMMVDLQKLGVDLTHHSRLVSVEVPEQFELYLVELHHQLAIYRKRCEYAGERRAAEVMKERDG